MDRATALLTEDRPLAASKALDLGSRVGAPPFPLLLQLAHALQRRGYLGAALSLYAAAATAAPTAARRAKLRRRSRRLRSAIELLSGRADPPLPVDVLTERVPGRVLHVVKQTIGDTQSGYTIRTHRTAAAQVRAGRDVHVVAQLGIGDEGHPTTWVRDGVTYHYLFGPTMVSMDQQEWFAQHVHALADVVRTLRPEVLHAASNHLNARAARIVGSATGTPVVYEVRGFWEETAMSRNARTFGWQDLAELEAHFGLPDYYLLHRSAEAREWQRADAVVTLAPVMKERITAAGVDPARVHLVPNAIDADEFGVAERDPELIRALGLADDTQVVGYVSSFVEYEGIDDLIRAFALLRARRGPGEPPIALLLVGDGPDRGRLEEVADEVGREGIVFAGKVPHSLVTAHYGLIDVFVVPRRPVPVCELVTPLKPYEALALGRAMVMSDVAALAGIAHESAGALLARAGHPDSFADQIERLVNAPEDRAALAAAGRSWVVAERTWEINARLYESVYAEVAGLIDS